MAVTDDPDMTDTVDNLILDLIEWVGKQQRTYQETMEAWRTSCPRLPVWEDACERGFVERAVANNRVLVRPTPGGLAFLRENRPVAYEALRSAKSPGFAHSETRQEKNRM